MDLSHYLSVQNTANFCLSLKIKFAYLHFFIEFCEKLSDSISYFEAEETKHIDSKPDDLWQIEVYLAEYPDLNEIKKQVELLSISCNIMAPEISLTTVKNCDWALEVQKTFAPINADLFFIHYSGYQETLPDEQIIIEINAGQAFGTGGHETTNNCLKALSRFKDKNFINCLDMGCGSGILAIAMAKLWPNQILAVDLDERAVLVAKENTNKNNVPFVKVALSDGYNSPLVRQNAPYQLITANILAAPLIDMAADAYKNLAKNGILIIAGFLNDQKEAMLEAHEREGFVLLYEICLENWPALVLKKMD